MEAIYYFYCPLCTVDTVRDNAPDLWAHAWDQHVSEQDREQYALQFNCPVDGCRVDADCLTRHLQFFPREDRDLLKWMLKENAYSKQGGRKLAVVVSILDRWLEDNEPVCGGTSSEPSPSVSVKSPTGTGATSVKVEAEIGPWACKTCELWIHSHWVNKQQNIRVECTRDELLSLGVILSCPMPQCGFEYARERPDDLAMHFEGMHKMYGKSQPYILEPEKKDFQGRTLWHVKTTLGRHLLAKWSRQVGMSTAATLKAREGRFCVCTTDAAAAGAR